MIPKIVEELPVSARDIPTRTYRANEKTRRICGWLDELEAMKQAIYFRLRVEQGDYEIHRPGYGVALRQLIGKPIPYALPEIERLVAEALLQDDRITAVTDFDFQTQRGKVTASFMVSTSFGTVEAETEVEL